MRRLHACYARSARDVSSHNIELSTSNGIVTLTGTVDNLLAKRRAADLARVTQGVMGVVNLVDSDDITITVVQGVVRLTGMEEDWQEVRDAAKNAWEGGARDRQRPDGRDPVSREVARRIRAGPHENTMTAQRRSRVARLAVGVLLLVDGMKANKVIGS